MSEWNFIIAAYTLTGCVLVTYAALLVRRVKRARNRLEDGSKPGGMQ
jgi:hypothetical protein